MFWSIRGSLSFILLSVAKLSESQMVSEKLIIIFVIVNSYKDYDQSL